MAYATMDDIVELYGPDALFAADRDGDGEADAAAVARAIEDAGEEVDSYLGVRYPVPLSDPVPGLVRKFAVDLALYRLAMTADVISDAVRARRDDAVDHLKLIAAGKASLPIDPPQGEEPDTARPIVSSGPDRLFSRDAMRDL